MTSMTDDFTPLTGRCMCGAVEISTAAPFVGALYCHCKRCQRRSGTTRSMTALCPPGAFSVTAGQDKVRIWDPGDGWRKAFSSIAAATRIPSVPTTRRSWRSASDAWTKTPASARKRISSSRTPAHTLEVAASLWFAGERAQATERVPLVDGVGVGGWLVWATSDAAA